VRQMKTINPATRRTPSTTPRECLPRC
jgi:hypothetical protein